MMPYIYPHTLIHPHIVACKHCCCCCSCRCCCHCHCHHAAPVSRVTGTVKVMLCMPDRAETDQYTTPREE